MVCISGGKDSFLLAKCIQELERHGKIKFKAEYVVMDPGYNGEHREGTPQYFFCSSDKQTDLLSPFFMDYVKSYSNSLSVNKRLF